MAKKITRLAASEVNNQPQLILASELANICAYIDKRNNGYVWNEEIEKAAVAQQKLGYDEDGCWKPYSVENGIAIIDINGALTYRPTMFQALCGGCSYSALVDAADEISKDPSISTVVLMIDSGGGQAYGAFETSEYLKKKIKDSNKKLITYVDGMMASAAYALGCCADEVIMNPDSQAGSIGVVVHLEDESEKKKMEGEKDIWVYAGKSKVPFAEDGSFKKDFLDDLQKSVNDTYNKFTTLVSSMRGISQEAVINTEAKVFKAEDAIKLGLADKQMTRSDFADYLANIVNAEEIELPDSPTGESEDYEEDSGCGKKKKKMTDSSSENNKGDTLEVNDTQEASVLNSVQTATVDPAIAEQLAELARLKEMEAQFAQFQQEKAELEAAAKAQELAAIKTNYVNMVQSLGFVPEDKVEAVAEATFKLRETLGEEASLIIDQLAAARDVIENMKQHMTVEVGADAEDVVVEESEQERATKSLDAKIAEKYGVK